MGTDWISEFQQEMDQIETQLRIVQEACHSLALSPREDQYLGTCVELIDKMRLWSRALSSDDAVWALVDVPRLCHQMIGRLTIVSGYFDMLSKDRQPASADAASAAESIKALVSLCYGAGYMIGGSQRTEERPWMNWTFYTLRPEIVLEVLRLSLYPNYAAHWHVAPMPDEAFVPFHPYHSQRLLCFLIEEFNAQARSQAVTVRATASIEGLTMTMTAPAVRFTPALWQDFLASLRSSAHDDTIEVWREMGGTIEPLTWDTGQGEGVIVRLPWAKP